MFYLSLGYFTWGGTCLQGLGSVLSQPGIFYLGWDLSSGSRKCSISAWDILLRVGLVFRV